MSKADYQLAWETQLDWVSRKLRTIKKNFFFFALHKLFVFGNYVFTKSCKDITESSQKLFAWFPLLLTSHITMAFLSEQWCIANT